MLEKLSAKKKIEYEVLYTSLVGRQIEITNSKIKTQIGVIGVIIYETASFFHLRREKDKKIVKILKKNISFNVNFDGKALNIDGRLLLLTVLPRIKKIKWDELFHFIFFIQAITGLLIRLSNIAYCNLLLEYLTNLLQDFDNF